eukprot:scaffold93306_cov42-Prasinocladus_malaysianus.AAC.1
MESRLLAPSEINVTRDESVPRCCFLTAQSACMSKAQRLSSMKPIVMLAIQVPRWRSRFLWRAKSILHRPSHSKRTSRSVVKCAYI